MIEGPNHQSPSDQATPLFSLLNGEGAGALLASAAGDVAGGASPVGYSALTQQATVVAYHLLRNDRIDRSALVSDWLELAAEGDSPSLYRAPSEDFEAFLKAALEGVPAATAEPSAEPAARVHPIGVWFRRQPDRLLENALLLGRLTHSDAGSVLGAVVIAGAVAASCFAQSGRDLLRAAVEVGERCLAEMGEDDVQFSRLDDARAWQRTLHETVRLSKPIPDLTRETIEGELGPRALPIAALLLASPVGDEPYRQIERAAALGGTELAVMVGAIVGARVGIRSWPWVIPNDTWFAEIGRRLVSGNRETRDIPVPNHVEERLSLGGAGPLF